MNKVTLAGILVSGILAATSCSDKCQVTNKYIYYTPVYTTTAEIKAAVAFLAARDISSPGRIYLKDHTLFVNESGKGIHVIDNTNPASPKKLGFLNIPGNYDLAVIGNTLYADSYVDLVAFDISDISSIHEVKRIETLFNHYSSMGFSVDAQKGIVTSWKKQENVSIEKADCSTQVQAWGGIYYDGGIALTADASASFNPQVAVAPVSNTGIGGSTARFTIEDNYLYALDGTYLDVVDVSTPTSPSEDNEMMLSWDAQTLFPYNNNLFVGTRSGMFIYDLSTPQQPLQIGQFEHIQTCDPVVVEGNYAYVTLYSGTGCHVNTNELQVIDITHIQSPALVNTYQMTNPKGLGIDHGTLFICDGAGGLKIYDAADVNAIGGHLLAQYTSINAYDIIPFENIAMVIASDGLYQYDYSDRKNIKLLSKLPIVSAN